MFLIDKYSINSPFDVKFNYSIYKKLLKLKNLNDNINKLNNKSFDNMPNILLYGKSGCGKKSLVSLFLKRLYGKNIKVIDTNYTIIGYGNSDTIIKIPQSLYHIEIYPSGSGLDKYIVQEVIKSYANKKVLSFDKNYNFKVIWIHNIDKLSYYAQTALRCTMEKYSNICKFILTSSQISKILEPLRSRCLIISIPRPNNSDIMKVLMNISYHENNFLKLSDYINIINKSDNNIKSAIQYLEMSYYNIPLKTSWKCNIKEIVRYMKMIMLNGNISDNITNIREILYKIFVTNIEGINIIKELMEQILKSLKNQNINYDIIKVSTQYEQSIFKGKRTIIHIESYIYNMIYIIYKEMILKKK